MNIQQAHNLVPAIAAMIWKLKEGNIEPQAAAIQALGVNMLMSALVEDIDIDCNDLLKLADMAMERANALNNDMKKFHVEQSIVLIGTAYKLKFLDRTVIKDGGIDSFKITDKWIDFSTVRTATLPSSKPFTGDDHSQRRRDRVKGGGVCNDTLKEAQDFLGSTAFHVNELMLNILVELYKLNPKRKEIDTQLFVIFGSKQMVKFDELYSEYFSDQRGRMYHVACAGANPQSSDLARCLYALNVEQYVEHGSPAHEMFMNEFEDVTGCDYYMKDSVIRRVAANPVGALSYMLDNKGNGVPKKPFTYVRLCFDYIEFEDNGRCDSRLGYGLDAKCSGTQYMAAVSGSAEMLAATGFRLEGGVTMSLDPYQLSLIELVKGLKVSTNPVLSGIDIGRYLNPKTGRSFIKTPYMAVQYGGSKKALIESKKLRDSVRDMGLRYKKDLEAMAEMCVGSIKVALGYQINHFIAATKTAVEAKLAAMGVTHFPYTHTDGFIVNRPEYEDILVCDQFSIRIGKDSRGEMNRCIFGNLKEETGWTVKSDIPSAQEFARKFVVNYIQGIDALVARTITLHAKRAGLRGFNSIHDCFRCCLADAPKMMDVIRSAYMEIFVDNDQFAHISEQVGGILHHAPRVVTKENVMSEHSYYFCQ